MAQVAMVESPVAAAEVEEEVAVARVGVVAECPAEVEAEAVWADAAVRASTNPWVVVEAAVAAA